MGHCKPNRPSVFVVTAVLLAVILLACGQAGEVVQQEQGNLAGMTQDKGSSDITPETAEDPTRIPESAATPEPTPEPTPESAPEASCEMIQGSYPNLDATLADIVHKYETCELDEKQAAALADLHEGTRVVVTVDLTTNGDTAVLEQMGKWEMDPRFQVEETDPDFIYAYVKVSALGELSQLEGLSQVRGTENFLPEGSVWENPPSPYAARTYRDGTTMPELLWWLKGYRHEGTYPKITGLLNGYYRMYRQGKMTEDRKAEETCMFVDDTVNVTLLVESDSATAIRSYLAANDVTVKDNWIAEAASVTYIGAIVPWSLIADLMENEGLVSIDGNGCPNRDASEKDHRSSQNNYKGSGNIRGDGLARPCGRQL